MLESVFTGPEAVPRAEAGKWEALRQGLWLQAEETPKEL